MLKIILYCCKAKPYLVNEYDNHYGLWDKLADDLCLDILNGTIPCECEIETEEIEKIYGSNHACFDKDGYFDDYADYVTKSLEETKLLKHSCLTSEELENYLQDKNGYAIHIKNLHIFDKPKALSEYYYYDDVRLTKAPQNMRYAFDEENNEYILISIQPQWLCKILNGEKDIEVRKKVLNCMKEKM